MSAPLLDEALAIRKTPRRRYLTVDTPIPTARRAAIRAFIKRQHGFYYWHMGILKSRNVRNRDLLAFAIEKDFSAQIEDMLTCPLEDLK